MRGSKAKALRKESIVFATAYLKTLLTPDQAELVTEDSIKEFESKQEQYILGGCGEVRVAPYSTKMFYKRLKKAYKNKMTPDFMLNSVAELG